MKQLIMTVCMVCFLCNLQAQKESFLGNEENRTPNSGVTQIDVDIDGPLGNFGISAQNINPTWGTLDQYFNDDGSAFFFMGVLNSAYPGFGGLQANDGLLMTDGPSNLVLGTAATNNSSFMYFNQTTDNIGIGTNTPANAKLHIDADSGAGLNITTTGNEIARFESSITNSWISMYHSGSRVGTVWATGNTMKFRSDNGGVAFQTDGNNDRINILTTGEVGINQSAPSAQLDVVGDSELNGDLNADSGVLFADASADNVGINTTSPDFTFEVEHITGIPGATSGNGLTIKNKAGGTDNFWTLYNFSSGNLTLYQAGVLKGTFAEADGMYTPASDRKLKTNIQKIEDQILDKVMELKPSSYQFKSAPLGVKEYGLIAQEVQEVFPELAPVIQAKTDGAKEELLGVNYMEFVPILIKATQEQQEIIEKQNEMLEALLERIEALENKN